MNTTKKINVNFSSLVGLKAELLRKQTEVNEAKLKTEPINVLPQLNKKRNKKTVTENAEKNTKEMIDSEDIVAHKKSKLMLEAKSRLYERLKKSKNNNDKFLVDFKNKLDESDEEFVDEIIQKEYPVEPEENWVEYQDCFGRTRKCLREDLLHMQRKDNLIKQEIMKNADNTGEEENKEQYSTTEEKESEIEIMRRKWEEQTQKLADKVDIHYQDILFDEARTHGVGYYAFSQDEEERVKQQENLTNLRKETEKKQKEMKEINELKERMEQNRLKAARIRQRIRAGLPAEPTEEELVHKDKLIDSITTTDNINAKEANNESVVKNEEKSSEEINNEFTIVKKTNINEKVADNEDKIRAFGKLLGKKNYWHVMSQEEWVDKCRAQRINEFAPIYDNFMNAGFYNSNQSTEQSICKDKELDNIEMCNPTSVAQQATENFNTDSEKSETNTDSVNEPILIAKDIDNNSRNDKNGLAEYDTASNKNNPKHELSRNTIESTLNPTKNSFNLSSQKQAPVSYPLSHLSTNYSQNMYGYLGASEQHELLNNMDIPLPEDSVISTTFSDSFTQQTSKQEPLSRNINEDSIMAGLKYLREKFEENHNK